jgi:pimeloyl-ACP methyl ester carboxylesterase
MRGYGDSAMPKDVAAYSVLDLVGDMTGLVAALGERKAVIVGHDWGAIVAWAAAQLRPDLFPAVVAMSVPFRRRTDLPPLEVLRRGGQSQSYLLYFQTPGLAEAEFERDLPTTFRRLFGSRAKAPLEVAPGHGVLELFAEPTHLPDWLTEDDIAIYVAAFRRTGFAGGFNYYRNIDRNWALLAPEGCNDPPAGPVHRGHRGWLDPRAGWPGGGGATRRHRARAQGQGAERRRRPLDSTRACLRCERGADRVSARAAGVKLNLFDEEAGRMVGGIGKSRRLRH